MSSGLGGLNKSPHGVVIGLAQLALPDPHSREALWQQTQSVVAMVGKARRSMPTMDLIVFPEYSLQGLSMDTSPEVMCSLDGPEVAALRAACVEHPLRRFSLRSRGKESSWGSAASSPRP